MNSIVSWHCPPNSNVIVSTENFSKQFTINTYSVLQPHNSENCLLKYLGSIYLPRIPGQIFGQQYLFHAPGLLTWGFRGLCWHGVFNLIRIHLPLGLIQQQREEARPTCVSGQCRWVVFLLKDSRHGHAGHEHCNRWNELQAFVPGLHCTAGLRGTQYKLGSVANKQKKAWDF